MMVTNDFYLEIQQEENILFMVSQGIDRVSVVYDCWEVFFFAKVC